MIIASTVVIYSPVQSAQKLDHLAGPIHIPWKPRETSGNLSNLRCTSRQQTFSSSARRNRSPKTTPREKRPHHFGAAAAAPNPWAKWGTTCLAEDDHSAYATRTENGGMELWFTKGNEIKPINKENFQLPLRSISPKIPNTAQIICWSNSRYYNTKKQIGINYTRSKLPK